MAKTGKKIGRFLSSVRKSEFWRGVTKVTHEMRDLPTTLMREAEIEDLHKELEQNVNQIGGIAKEFQQNPLKEFNAEIQTSLDSSLTAKDKPNSIKNKPSLKNQADLSSPEGGNA